MIIDNDGKYITKHVFGLGLPRTGGTSLAEALRSMGYHGTNSCIVTNKTVVSDYITTPTLNEYKTFLIDNESPEYFNSNNIEGFYAQYNIDLNITKFILTTREQKSWEESLLKYNRVPTKSVPDIKAYERKVRDAIAPENLLVLNLSKCKKKCYNNLCDFLGEPRMDEKDFPCENC